MQSFDAPSYLDSDNSVIGRDSVSSVDDGDNDDEGTILSSNESETEHDPESAILRGEDPLRSDWDSASHRLPHGLFQLDDEWNQRSQEERPTIDDYHSSDDSDDNDDDDDYDDNSSFMVDSSSSSESSSDSDEDGFDDSQSSMSLDSEEELNRRQRSINDRLEQLTDQYRNDVQQLMDQVRNVMRSISTTPETARRTQEVVLMMSSAITDILLEQQQRTSRETRRGTCPDYLERLPRTVLKEESPVFFNVKLRFTGSDSIKGKFLPTGTSLKEGTHNMSIVETRNTNGSVAILLRGKAADCTENTSFHKQITREQLGSPVLYSWITDSIALEELVGQTQKPVIHVKHEDATALSNATMSCEVIVEKEVQTCAVCAEDFEVGHNVLRLPNCGHYYHQDCILPWLRCHNTCPTCRDKLPRPQQSARS